MMSPAIRLALAASAALLLCAAPALARKAKPAAAAPAASAPAEAAAAPAADQPTSLGQFGDWQAFTVGGGKDKSCFALSNPKERKPAGLNRDPATFFVTHRPGGGAKNEVSFIAGFKMKDGADAKIAVGKAEFALYAKLANAWVKNAAEEGTVVATMKKSKDVVFEGVSARGNKTTDRYSLTGFAPALDAIAKGCP